MHLKSSTASLGNVTLVCNYHPLGFNWDANKPIPNWVSQVFIEGIDYKRCGKHRSSERLAKRDAEEMAVELEMDAREGARQLMAKYGMIDDE